MCIVCGGHAVSPQRLYCGHGPCVGAIAAEADAGDSDVVAVPVEPTAINKIEEYIKHRMDREAQVLAAFRVRAGACAQLWRFAVTAGDGIVWLRGLVGVRVASGWASRQCVSLTMMTCRSRHMFDVVVVV